MAEEPEPEKKNWFTRLRPAAWPVHPVLFAAYPILFLFAANVAEQLALDPMVPPLAVSMLVTLVMLGCLRFVMGGWLRAGLATTVAVALFFSYGHVRGLLETVVEGGVRQRYLLPAWGVLLLAGLVVAVRLPRPVVRTVTTVLNLVAAFLVVVNLVPIIGFQLNGISVRAAAREGPVASLVPGSVERTPDIYYLVFDRYASADTLQHVYDFDNTPFVEQLQSRGFYVAADSDANYLKTALSLASSLSMDYLDVDALRSEAASRDDLRPIYARTRSGQAVQNYLGSLGYTYVHLGSWFYMTAANSAADLTLSYSEDAEFAAVLSDTTLLSATSVVLGDEAVDRHRQRWEHTRYQFDRLLRLAEQPGPKFVFAHFILPHPPFVFDRTGAYVSEPQQRERGRARGYVEMIEYGNARILELVNALTNGPVGDHPVIVVQADEGPYPHPRVADDNRWDLATPDEMREKYGILNAYYLPGLDDPGLYPTITPVNSFRLIFNSYFDAGLQILPDRSYAPFHVDYPYEQFEITEIVRGDFGDPP